MSKITFIFYRIKGNFIDDKVSGNVILTTDNGDLYYISNIFF